MSSKPSRQQAQLRAEQEKKRKQQQYLVIGGGIVAALIVIVGVVLLLSPRSNQGITNTTARCANLQTLEDEGRDHLKPGDPAPVYKSVPPTSGIHNPVWAQAGVYSDNVDVTQLVHSLEHGYIIMYYNGISQDEINNLINIQRGDSYKLIVAPYPNMPYKVALVAWTHRQTCEGVDTATIRSFIDLFRNQGPEQAP